MKKLLLKILAMLLVIVIVNNIVFSFIKLPFSWGFYYDKEKCLEANAGEYNTLLMGSSRVGRQIDPVLFDSLNTAGHQKTSSINLGMDGATIAEVYYQFNHIINQKNLHTKFALVELCDVDTFTYENLHTIRKKYYYNFGDYCNSVSSLLQSSYSLTRKVIGTTMHTFNFAEHLLRFNELGSVVKFKKTDQKANYNCNHLYDPFTIRENDTSSATYNGVRQLNPHAQFMKHPQYLNENRNVIAAVMLQKPAEPGLADNAYLQMANDMIAQGEKHAITVIFILPPKVGEAHFRTVLQVYNQLKPENKIALASPSEFPEFYNMKYTYDLGHLDKNGAAIFTQKLSEQFLKITGAK